MIFDFRQIASSFKGTATQKLSAERNDGGYMAEICWLLFFVILSVIFRLRALEFVFERYLGGYHFDAGLYVWLSEATGENLLGVIQNPGSWMTSTAFYPYGKTLAWSDNYILPSLLSFALRIFDNPLRYNLIYQLTFILNGYCAFRFGRLLSQFSPMNSSEVPAATHSFTRVRAGGSGSGLLLGVSFCTYGFFQQHAGHPQLQWAFWLPLGLESLFRFIGTRSLSSALVCGLAVSGAFLSCVYYAIILCLLYLLISPGVLLVSARTLKPLAWMGRGVTFLGGLLPLVPVIPAYLKVMYSFGARSLMESHYFAATPRSFLAASDLSHWYSSLATLSHPESRLFPGIVGLILWCIGISGAVRLNPRIWIGYLTGLPVAARSGILLLLAALATYFLPAVWLGGLVTFVVIGLIITELRALRQAPLPVRSKYLCSILTIIAIYFALISFGPLHSLGVVNFLHKFFPGFAAIRAIGRLGIVSALCLFAAGSLAIQRICKGRHGTQAAVAYMISAAIVIDCWHPIIPVEGPVGAPVILKEAAEKIRTSGAVTLVLPLATTFKKDGTPQSWTEFSGRNIQAMLWGQELGLPVVNGYSGQRTWLMDKLPHLLATFPSAEAVGFVRRIGGVGYILLSAPHITEEQMKKIVEAIPDQPISSFRRDTEGFFLFELSPSGRSALIRIPAWCPVAVQLKYAPQEYAKKLAESVYLKQSMSNIRVPLENIKEKSSDQYIALEFVTPINSVGVHPWELSFEETDQIKIDLSACFYR